jgi:transcriptional regulator with XRE-family HTH domain
MVDATGRVLLQRIQELLAARSDLTKADFFNAIGRPTASWRSEFLAGKRTTNNLRLVMRIAKFFGVPIAYLLGESEPERDAALIAVISAWPELDDASKRVVMNSALMLKGRVGAPANGPSSESSGEPGRGGNTTKGPGRRR